VGGIQTTEAQNALSPLVNSLQKRYTEVRKEATDTSKPVKDRANFLFAYVRNEGGPLIQVKQSHQANLRCRELSTDVAFCTRPSRRHTKLLERS
jgi:hypothetical protein